MTNEKVKVTRIKGLSGRSPDVRDTVKALGLSKVGRVREFTLNPCVYGMLRKISHMVKVEKLN